MSMKEPNLAKAIDRLASIRAEAFMLEVRNKIKASLSTYYRPKIAGEEFVGEDIKNILIYYAKHTDNTPYPKPTPTEKLLNACRATIINDLLAGLPKIKELMELQSREEPDAQDS